jgi:hypothetical protein
MVNPVAVVTPRINFPLSIRDLLHEVRIVRSGLEAQIERLDRMERDLAVLAGTHPDQIGTHIVHVPGQVAYNMDTRQNADGSVVVAIDGGTPFSLGPRLAEVFQFIATAEKDRDGQDALVGWRTRAEILKLLGGPQGRPFHPRYVNNIVHLLKEALRKAGYDRNLIQTNRLRGIRLALKRGQRVLRAGTPRSW